MLKVGNPCPTLGQLLANRILYALLVEERQHEIARARFCTQSCSEVGQLWEGRKVPTKSLLEQEAPEIGTQKCSTKRGVRESGK